MSAVAFWGFSRGGFPENACIGGAISERNCHEICRRKSPQNTEKHKTKLCAEVPERPLPKDPFFQLLKVPIWAIKCRFSGLQKQCFLLLANRAIVPSCQTEAGFEENGENALSLRPSSANTLCAMLEEEINRVHVEGQDFAKLFFLEHSYRESGKKNSTIRAKLFTK